MKMKLTEAAAYLKGKLTGSDAEFQCVSTDTRTLKAGELFIALQGPHFDGHHFIIDAQKKGAIAALVSQPIASDIPSVQVTDTCQALGQLAQWRREQLLHIPLIALTGSCGKTTVKEMLRCILHESGATLATQGTLNNDIGVPLTLLKLTPQHRFAVIEMGANHPGEIAYLTHMAKPNVAFINNIAPAHLEGFGSIEGVARAKAEIFQGLAADGIAIINADDEFAAWLQAEVLAAKKIVSFGIKNSATVSAREIKLNAAGCCEFILQTPAGDAAIQLPLLGQHNVLNALAAATATQALGMDLTAIKAGLEKVQPVAGRLMTRAGHNGARIFDDTYNANPTSIKAALQVLAHYSGEKIFVMGDMGEMGADAENYHREIGHFAKQLGIHHLYAYGKWTSFTVDAFADGGQHFASQAELSAAVRAILQKNLTVLVKGSRSAKMENVVAALMD